MVRTVFTEVQPFKRMENYFNDSLYQEDIEPLKQSLPDDLDNDNKADSESEEDALGTIIIEPSVAYLNDYDCNNPSRMKTSGSLMRILLLIIPCVLRMYLSMLGPCTCLYQSQK